MFRSNFIVSFLHLFTCRMVVRVDSGFTMCGTVTGESRVPIQTLWLGSCRKITLVKLGNDCNLKSLSTFHLFISPPISCQCLNMTIVVTTCKYSSARLDILTKKQQQKKTPK